MFCTMMRRRPRRCGLFALLSFLFAPTDFWTRENPESYSTGLCTPPVFLLSWMWNSSGLSFPLILAHCLHCRSIVSLLFLFLLVGIHPTVPLYTNLYGHYLHQAYLHNPHTYTYKHQIQYSSIRDKSQFHEPTNPSGPSPKSTNVNNQHAVYPQECGDPSPAHRRNRIPSPFLHDFGPGRQRVGYIRPE